MVPKTPFDVMIEAAKPRALGFRQFQVDMFVRGYHAEHGVAPSLRIIRDALGFSDKADVSKCLKSLVERGLMKHGPSHGTPGNRSHRPVIQL